MTFRPAVVASSEDLTRYLLERGKFSRENERVKYNAFMPTITGNVSVFRTSELSDAAIWRIGTEHVESVLKKAVLARAELKAHVVADHGLTIQPSEPPRRRANISGWPSEQTAVRLRAMRLAEESRLVVR